MRTEKIRRDARFTKKSRCPICNGYESLPRGHSKRCYGFLSGKYTHCTREEYANGITIHPGSETYSHRISGRCKCGSTHNKSSREHSNAQTQRFKILDEFGKVQAVHCRVDKVDSNDKDVWWEGPNGEKGLGGRPVNSLPLYGTRSLSKKKPGKPVLVVEGERKRDLLRKMGFRAVGTVTGANGAPCDKALAILVKHDIVLWPDADIPGSIHMDRIASRLHALNAKPRILNWKTDPNSGKDAVDFFSEGGTRNALRRMIRTAPLWVSGRKEEVTKLELISAAALGKKKISQLRWAIPGLLPEGLTLLGGQPKMGKSAFCMGIGLSIGLGKSTIGDLTVEKGDVIYISLEDTERRLQDRLRFQRPGRRLPARLYLGTKVANLSDQHKGIQQLDETLSEFPNCRLLIVDPFEIARPPRRIGANVYGEDYAAIRPIKELAEKRRVALVLVVHLRKGESRHWIQNINGSNGLSAAADCIWQLEKEGDRGTLRMVGRDIPERRLDLKWTPSTLSWTICGYIPTTVISDKRGNIIKALKTSGIPMTPVQLSRELGVKHGNVKTLLKNMRTDQQILAVGNGTYRLPEGNPNISHIPDTPDI